MAKTILANCPVCGEKLIARSLYCEDCKTEINGEFELSKFDYLNKQQLEFVLVFIKNAGSIKAIEEELNISYPTVKKYLQDVQEALGLTYVNQKEFSKEEILAMLKNGEIDFQQADEMLKKIEG